MSVTIDKHSITVHTFLLTFLGNSYCNSSILLGRVERERERERKRERERVQLVEFTSGYSSHPFVTSCVTMMRRRECAFLTLTLLQPSQDTVRKKKKHPFSFSFLPSFLPFTRNCENNQFPLLVSSSQPAARRSGGDSLCATQGSAKGSPQIGKSSSRLYSG